MDKTAAAKSKSGCGPLAIIVILFVIIASLFGINEGIEAYSLKCNEGENIMDCLGRREIEESLTEEQKNSLVTATGQYSFNDYSVTVTAKIPLAGGPVIGTMSGTCSGKLRGSFSGKDNGGIEGKVKGSCSPFVVALPAGATFAGSVNKDAKTVPIGFIGKGAGLTHEGSMVLSY